MNKKLQLFIISLLFLFIIVNFVYATLNLVSVKPTKAEVLNNTYVFNATVGNGLISIVNVSWYYYNSTGNYFIGTVLNTTGNQTTFWNITNDTSKIQDGNYTLNITAYNITYTSTRPNETGFFVNDTNGSITFIVDNKRPVISLVNITDGTNNRLDSNNDLNGTKFLKNDTNLTITVTIDESFNDLLSNNTGAVRIYFNQSGYPANTSHAYFNMTNITGGGRTRIYNGSIPAGANAANVSFLISVNETHVPARPPTQANNSNSGFNFTFDGVSPGTTVSVSPTIIDKGQSVTLSCSAPDLDPGASTSFWVKKPGADTYESATSPYTDTQTGGTHTFKCTATDTSGNSRSATTTFEVQSSGSGGSGGSGGGGGGGGTATTTEEVEELITGNEVSLGTITSTGISKSFSEEDGGRLTFSGEEHVFAITSITAYEVTLIIASITPIELTIPNGGFAQVDLDENGIDDLLITVKSIIRGKADITFKALEKPEVTVPTQPTVKKAPTQQTWLWILLVVIVIAVAVYLMAMRKKR